MSRRRDGRSKAEFLKIWGPLLTLVALGFAVAIATLDEPPPKTARLAAGSPGGAYHAFAERYREVLRREGFELEVVETAGSIENLELLRGGEVDLALVQGGTAGENADGLEALASLFLEPVWLFCRADAPPEHLRDLSGRRVSIGAPRSGTQALARELLSLNALEPSAFELYELGSADAAAALEARTIDAAFFVSSVQAKVIKRLLADGSLELFSFGRHRAYSYRLPFLSPVVLGEGLVDLAKDLPEEDVHLLAAAASLAAREELHEDLVPLLLETMETVHGPGGIFEPAGRFPSEKLVDLPLKSTARQYLIHGPSFLHRILPFGWAVTIDRWKILLLPFLTLLIPIFKIAPPLYRWRIRSKIYRWYDDLRLTDELLHEEDENLGRAELEEHLERLRRLEAEVATEVSVPLSYMDEYYRLRVHIELILMKLERLTERQVANS